MDAHACVAGGLKDWNICTLHGAYEPLVFITGEAALNALLEEARQRQEYILGSCICSAAEPADVIGPGHNCSASSSWRPSNERMAAMNASQSGTGAYYSV